MTWKAIDGRRRDRFADGVAVAAAWLGAAWLLDPVGGLFAAIWAVLVMIVIRSDLESFVIPDAASAAIAGLGLLHAVVAATIADAALLAGANAAGSAALNGLTAFALFWFVSWAFAVRTGRDGLGFGDVKLAGALAFWLDVTDQVAALEIAALAAIAVVLARSRRDRRETLAIPFGAFLGPAAWLVFVAGPAVRRMLGYG